MPAQLIKTFSSVYNDTQCLKRKRNQCLNSIKIISRYSLVIHTDVPKTVVENNQQGMWKQYLNNNPKFQDYGEKHGEIVDYAIIDETGKITSNIQKNTEFTIKMKVRFHKELQEPIFAFTIKDLQGTEVTGTNTMYEDIPVGPVKARHTACQRTHPHRKSPTVPRECGRSRSCPSRSVSCGIVCGAKKSSLHRHSRRSCARRSNS